MTRDYRSRFAGMCPRAAWLVIIALALVVIASVAPTRASRAPTGPIVAQPTQTLAVKRDEDLALYNAITRRVGNGEPYYPVVAEELRKGNYPLRPFITVRLPTLAVIGCALGPTATRIALWLLILGTLIVWYRRLDGAFEDRGRRITGVLLVASGMTVAMRPEYAVVHEVWAGLLLALSLALHRPDRWWPSLMAALAAVMIRELALPFLLLMGAFALFERRPREAAAWAAAASLFGIALFLHAQQVALVTTAADPPSPGWTTLGGWPAFLRAMSETSALRVFPSWAAAILVILSLFGWTSWRTRTGLFGTLMFAGYAIIFMVLGRPENFYWGLIVSPLLLLGLAHLPQAFADLRRAG